ncbi:MAG TPA: cytochrome C oxidase subunit IV family protein [Ignavibacteriaceae bacterium]|nr:cytochrome C oxidase subunit IV family protein [Ignavibacteriaceae bacterium]
MNEQHTDAKHMTAGHGYGIYILVWLALLTLTGITVAVAGINLGGLTVAAALIIAAIKSYLVLTIFMHLRIEQTAFKVFVLVALFFIVISFALLFSDFSFMKG